MMMSFDDFVPKNKLKNKATSNIKAKQVLSSSVLSGVGIHSRDLPFSSDIGFVNIYPSRGTHWVCYINQIF